LTREDSAFALVTELHLEILREVECRCSREQQSGAVSTTIDSVSKLATAMKDLDRVGQLLAVSMGFFGVAAVAAGLESVANAIAK
jgi:hypothetical protein